MTAPPRTVKSFEAMPAELKELTQWCVWKLELDGKGKPTKVPYHPNGYKSSSTDSETWSTFEACKAAYEDEALGFAGVGFFFNDDYTGVDFDHCLTDNSIISDGLKVADKLSMALLQKLNSFTEISQSGTGVHSIIKAVKPKGSRCRTGNYEMYSRDRFFVMTGNVPPNAPTEIRSDQAAMEFVYTAIFKESIHDHENITQEGEQQQEQAKSSSFDEMAEDVLILKAKTAKNGNKFEALWGGSTLGYKSPSESDQALMNLLAFWTRGNAAQMERLFSRSGLGQRDKWRDRPDYRESTIQKAISDAKEFYEPNSNHDSADGVLGSIELQLEDVCDIIKHTGTNKQTGEEYEWAEIHFNHAKAVDAILNRLPVVLGVDGLLYYFQGSTWSNQAEEILHNMLHGLAGKHFNQHQHKEVIAALKNLLTFSKVKLDPDPWLLGVKNGVVDLRTKEFRAYRKEDYISYSINVKYDTSATCPRFVQFLDEVCLRKVDRLTLIDWLTIHAIRKQFPYVLFLLGNGRNGKGVYEKLLLAIYESSAFSFMSLEELQKSVFAKADLAAKRGLIVSEAGDENARGKAILPTKFLKGSTGEGIIDSDRKNKTRIQFDPIFKSTVDCNDMPRINDRSRGWEERFCKADMPYIFVDNPDPANIYERKKDPRLINKLTSPEELSGILNLIILRAAEIFKTETIIKRSGKTTMAEYVVQSDSMRAFIDSFCTHAFDVRVENAASVRDVYAAYERFCQYPPKDKAVIEQFGAAIRKLCNNLEPKKINNIKRYPGFVFYKDEFEEYMKSSSDPLKSSDNPVKSITDPANPDIDTIWNKINLKNF